MNKEMRTFNKVVKQRERRRAYLRRKRQLGTGVQSRYKRFLNRKKTLKKIQEHRRNQVRAGFFTRLVNWFKRLWRKTK